MTEKNSNPSRRQSVTPASVVVTKSMLALQRVVSTDDARPALKNIWVHGDVAMATDGHHVFWVKLHQPEFEALHTRIAVPAAAARAVLPLMKDRKRTTATVELEPDALTLSVDAPPSHLEAKAKEREPAKLKWEPVEEKLEAPAWADVAYPPIRQLLMGERTKFPEEAGAPIQAAERSVAGLAPGFGKLVDAVFNDTEGEGALGVMMGGNADPFVYRWLAIDCVVTAVRMPVRLSGDPFKGVLEGLK